MQTDRIKWNEGMQTRCLARLTSYYQETAVPKKQVPVKAAESDYSFELEIPSVSPVTNVKVVQKSTKWDGFKNAIDNAI